MCILIANGRENALVVYVWCGPAISFNGVSAEKKTLKNPLLMGENSFLVVRVFLSLKFNSQRKKRFFMAFVVTNVARVQFCTVCC